MPCTNAVSHYRMNNDVVMESVINLGAWDKNLALSGGDRISRCDSDVLIPES